MTAGDGSQPELQICHQRIRINRLTRSNPSASFFFFLPLSTNECVCSQGKPCKCYGQEKNWWKDRIKMFFIFDAKKLKSKSSFFFIIHLFHGLFRRLPKCINFKIFCTKINSSLNFFFHGLFEAPS